MDHLALPVDQEFGEIPFDRLGPQNAGRFVLEPGVERMGVVAVDIDFGEEREGHIETGLAKLADGFGIARFLRTELVARKAENNKTPVLEAPVEFFEAGVLWREAALAGGIDDEQDVAAIGVEALLIAVQTLGAEVVKGLAHGNWSGLSAGAVWRLGQVF